MQVNLTSEREITKILEILVKIAAKQGVILKDDDLKEMLKEIEVSYIERKLEQQLKEHTFKPQKIVEEVEKVFK